MIYEGINFYPSSVEGKTETEFVAHEKHHGLSVAQLKEVYKLMNPKKKTKDSSLSVEKDNP